MKAPLAVSSAGYVRYYVWHLHTCVGACTYRYLPTRFQPLCVNRRTLWPEDLFACRIKKIKADTVNQKTKIKSLDKKTAKIRERSTNTPRQVTRSIKTSKQTDCDPFYREQNEGSTNKPLLKTQMRTWRRRMMIKRPEIWPNAAFNTVTHQFQNQTFLCS